MQRFEAFLNSYPHDNKEQFAEKINNFFETNAKKILVIGEVQSGKTTNFCGVINKAFDIGYKRIIVLSGVIESLRVQTQKRINKDVIGFKYKVIENSDKVELATLNEQLKNISPSLISLTDEKFQRGTNIASAQTHPNDYYICVIKKQKNALEQILKSSFWTGSKEDKFLIIDDECDNATLNCKNASKLKKNDDLSTINKYLLKILRSNPNSKYIGYTATPFLNFQNLIEKNFTPDEYYLLDIDYRKYDGLESWFSKQSNRVNIIENEEFSSEDTEITSHTMKKALLEYLEKSSNSFKENKKESVCMLINVSWKKDIHEVISRNVKQFIQNVIDKKVLLKNNIDQDFLRELKESGVKVINSKNDKNISDLNFEKRKFCIFIGGYALARGITIEGLRVSYLNRKETNFAVLLQMARFFGYHSNKDECSLYINNDRLNDFRKIRKIILNLRNEFEGKQYIKQNDMSFWIDEYTKKIPTRSTARGKYIEIGNFKEICIYSNVKNNSDIFNENKIKEIIKKYHGMENAFFDLINEKILALYKGNEIVEQLEQKIKKLKMDRWKIIISKQFHHYKERYMGNKVFNHIYVNNAADVLFGEPNKDLNLGTYVSEKGYEYPILFLFPIEAKNNNEHVFVLGMAFYFPDNSGITKNTVLISDIGKYMELEPFDEEENAD